MPFEKQKVTRLLVWKSIRISSIITISSVKDFRSIDKFIENSFTHIPETDNRMLIVKVFEEENFETGKQINLLKTSFSDGM